MGAVDRRRCRNANSESAVPADLYVLEHQRLLNGEPAAANRLAAALLRDVIPLVRRIVRLRDTGSVGPAVDDAILDYLRSPFRFEPRRGTLLNYVTGAAVRNVFNLERSESRRRRAEGRAAAWRDAVPALRDPAIDAPTIEQLVCSCCNAMERQFVRAWLEGAGTKELALIAGANGSVGVTDAKTVTRLRERLRQRLKRCVAARKAPRRLDRAG